MKIRCAGKLAGIVFASVVIAGTVGMTSANAQTTSPAAGCFVDPAKLPDAEIQAFLAAPQALLSQFASGGATLSSKARNLAGSSADALKPLLALAKQGSPSQAAAIGAGLARVARACVNGSPEYAATIQAEVAAAGAPGLETAFMAGLNDTQTAALGAGAGGAGGAGGGGAAAIGGGGTPGGGVNGVGSAGGENQGTATNNPTFTTRTGSNFFSNGSGTTPEMSCSNPNCS